MTTQNTDVDHRYLEECILAVYRNLVLKHHPKPPKRILKLRNAVMERIKNTPTTYAQYLILAQDVEWVYALKHSTKLQRSRNYFAFCEYMTRPLEEMSLLLGDASPILRAAAAWRLEIGK